ncbi:MAG: ABC transporter permease [Chloroflexia bacterium]|nr:ABC transporter permease [Chloroflexia bacterium]
MKTKKFTRYIKIISLGVGLACSLVIFYIAYNLINRDSFYPENEHIFQVMDSYRTPEWSGTSVVISQPIAPAMMDDFPMVEYGTVVRHSGKVRFKTNKSLFEAKTSYVDSLFFKIFKRPFLIGNESQVLKRVNKAVVTKAFAEKIFGHIDVLGEIFILNGERPIEIEAIIEDWPHNSSVQAEVLLSFETLRDEKRLYMGWNGGESFQGFVKLKSGADADKLTAAFPKFLRKYYDVDADAANGFSVIINWYL